MHFLLSWSVNYVISFVIWSVNHVTSFMEKMTSEVTFFLAGQSSDALKQRSLYQCALKVAGRLMLYRKDVWTSAL